MVTKNSFLYVHKGPAKDMNYGFVFVNNYQGGGLRRTMSSKLMTDKNDDLMHKFARNKSLPGNSISRSCLNKSRVLGLYKTTL